MKPKSELTICQLGDGIQSSCECMIRDLSLTMQAILDDPALAAAFPELAAAQILFDRPVEGFKPAQATVDLFLYDVRENMELRSNEPIIERNNGQAIIHRPPMRVLCSYLVTAWPGNVTGDEMALGEHRLLGQTLQALSRFPTIPPQYLKGSLIKQEPPLPMITAQTDGLKNPAEFWTALGNKLRPSISLTGTISMQPFAAETARMVQESEIRIGERTSPVEMKINPATLRDAFRIVGQITGAAGAPVPGALVSIEQTGLAAISDLDGRYTIGMLSAGNYTIRVESGQITKTANITIPAPAGKNFNVKLTG